MTATVVLHNYGRDPAEIVEILTNSRTYDAGLEPDPETVEYEPVFFELPEVMGAGEVRPITVAMFFGKNPVTITRRDLVEMLKNKRRRAVFGKIRYRGATEKEYRRSSFFWLIVDPNPDKKAWFRPSIDPRLRSRD